MCTFPLLKLFMARRSSFSNLNISSKCLSICYELIVYLYILYLPPPSALTSSWLDNAIPNGPNGSESLLATDLSYPYAFLQYMLSFFVKMILLYLHIHFDWSVYTFSQNSVYT